MTIYRKQKKEALDCILRDASEGYGDLVAASITHDVSLRSLELRLRELQEEEAV